MFEGEKRGRDILKAQDWLTTVVEQDTGHMQARVTGAMIDFIVPGDTAAVVAKLADPAIRIVSMTITEGGYFIDAATGKFDPAHPAIVADAANPDSPKTVFGLILAGLKRRKAEGTPPFTIMSCDNIPHNGHVTADAVCGLAQLSDPAFADVDPRKRRFPERHGRPHHARHHRPRARYAQARFRRRRTAGRSSASRSSNGCWRTISRSAARRWRRSACSSSRTFRPSN